MIIISRIVCALILGLIGYQIGNSADLASVLNLDTNIEKSIQYAALITVGIISGLIVGGLVGKLIQRLIENINSALRTRSGAELVVGALGLIVGLCVAFLISLPLRQLPFVEKYAPLIMTLVVAYVFAEIAAAKYVEILRLVGIRVDKGGAQGKLLDTSVLIDGRIGDIVKTGFLEGELIVPVFVLEELQHIADSSEDIRRARGRRGLEVVHKLRKDRRLTTPDEDYPDIEAVDSKLVRLARDNGYIIVTNDFNLNRIAQAQQVPVLNVNELANAIKSEFVAGERMSLKIVREGKEAGQGVGYLDDGTMVIVENAATERGNEVDVEVASVLQSPTGKLVFASKVV